MYFPHIVTAYIIYFHLFTFLFPYQSYVIIVFFNCQLCILYNNHLQIYIKYTIPFSKIICYYSRKPLSFFAISVSTYILDWFLKFLRSIQL
nr:MAG TPA: hypothetical protein [Caudoviricetes sp.]